MTLITLLGRGSHNHFHPLTAFYGWWNATPTQMHCKDLLVGSSLLCTENPWDPTPAHLGVFQYASENNSCLACTCCWTKETVLIFALSFTSSRRSDLFSHFISIITLRRDGNIFCVRREKMKLRHLDLLKIMLFHGRLNSSQASWLFTQCSSHHIVLLSLPQDLIWLSTLAPPHYTHTVWEIPTLHGSVPKCCNNSPTIEFCL
jgi:hypothetical protein